MPRLKQEVAVTRKLIIDTRPTITVSPRITLLAERRQTLSAQKKTIIDELAVIDAELLEKVKLKAKPDAKGKLRLETDTAKMIVISGENQYYGAAELMAAGVKASTLERAVKRTTYEYVGIYPKKEMADEEDS